MKSKKILVLIIIALIVALFVNMMIIKSKTLSFSKIENEKGSRSGWKIISLIS